jgi:hypothetical protein
MRVGSIGEDRSLSRPAERSGEKNMAPVFAPASTDDSASCENAELLSEENTVGMGCNAG